MTFEYTFKTRGDLTEADLPLIESPFFAREHLRSAYRHGTLNLHVFLCRRAAPFAHYDEQDLLRDFDEGELFAVRKDGCKPLRPLISKVEDETAPSGYRWEVDKYLLSGTALGMTSKLHHLIKFELPQRQRQQAKSQAHATAAHPTTGLGNGYGHSGAALGGGSASAASTKVSTLFLQLHAPPGANASSRYTLRGAKDFQAEKTVKDDKIADNDTLDFEFTEVPMDDTYELIVATDHEEIVLFRDIEFEDIRRQVIL